MDYLNNTIYLTNMVLTTKEHDMLNKPVKTSQAFMDWRYNLSDKAQTVFTYLLSQVHNEFDNPSDIHEIDVNTMCQLLQLPRHSLLNQTRVPGKKYKTTGEVMTRLDSITDELMKHVQHSRGKNWVKVNIFSSIEYRDGVLLYNFTEEARPHMYKIAGAFKQIGLYRLARVRCTYTTRILLMLAGIEKTDHKTKTFVLSELLDTLDVPDSYRLTFSDFRKKVLDKVKEEAYNVAGIDLSYELIKTGKRVTKIKFTVDYYKTRETLYEDIGIEWQE